MGLDQSSKSKYDFCLLFCNKPNTAGDMSRFISKLIHLCNLKRYNIIGHNVAVVFVLMATYMLRYMYIIIIE